MSNEKILIKKLERKNDCKDKKCKIDKKNIKYIFNPEGKLPKEIIDKLDKNSGNYKICDCIIVCKNGNIFIVEILCGKLTNKELKDKELQIINCKQLLKTIKVKYHKAYLYYNKLDKELKQKLKTYQTKLQSKGIHLRDFPKKKVCS